MTAQPSIMAWRAARMHRKENFPVASRLIAPTFRPVIMSFYRVARLADDIADSSDLHPQRKLELLDAISASLDDPGRPCPIAGPVAELRAGLASHGLSTRWPQALLRAFRQDVTKNRYADWQELMKYCDWSAAPVGRFVLDLHREDESLYTASDALCAALQVLNHLQDAAEDCRRLDRVYLPLAWLNASHADMRHLMNSETPASLRNVFDRCLDECSSLLDRSARLSAELKSRRLGAEVAVIQSIAIQLREKLRKADPLKRRVVLSRAEVAAAALRALPRLARP